MAIINVGSQDLVVGPWVQRRHSHGVVMWTKRYIRPGVLSVDTLAVVSGVEIVDGKPQIVFTTGHWSDKSLLSGLDSSVDVYDTLEEAQARADRWLVDNAQQMGS